MKSQIFDIVFIKGDDFSHTYCDRHKQRDKLEFRVSGEMINVQWMERGRPAQFWRVVALTLVREKMKIEADADRAISPAALAISRTNGAALIAGLLQCGGAPGSRPIVMSWFRSAEARLRRLD